MIDKEKGPGEEAPEPMGTVENSKRANSIPGQAGVQVNRIDAPPLGLPQVRTIVIDGRQYLDLSEYHRRDEERRLFDARRITLALDGEWYGDCGWAVCPVCQYDKASLAIGADDDGHLLLACYGGCSYGELTLTLDRLQLSFRPLIFCMPHGAEAALRQQVKEARAQAYSDVQGDNVD